MGDKVRVFNSGDKIRFLKWGQDQINQGQDIIVHGKFMSFHQYTMLGTKLCSGTVPVTTKCVLICVMFPSIYQFPANELILY